MCLKFAFYNCDKNTMNKKPSRGRKAFLLTAYKKPGEVSTGIQDKNLYVENG